MKKHTYICHSCNHPIAAHNQSCEVVVRRWNTRTGAYDRETCDCFKAQTRVFKPLGGKA